MAMSERISSGPNFEKADFKALVEKEEEYNKAIDDILKILDASENSELAKKQIRGSWVSTAKELKEEFKKLKDSFEEKYGVPEFQKLWGDHKLSGEEGLSKKEEEELILKLSKRLDVEEEFGLLEESPDFTKKVMDKIKKEQEGK